MKKPLIALAAILTATAVHAFEHGADHGRESFIERVSATVAPWLSDPMLVKEVLRQNAAHVDLSDADIQALDYMWRREVGSEYTPAIDAVMKNPASALLRERKEASNGLIAEIFVTDFLGLNVAASDPTSDLWQGDEDKFTKVYGHGPNAVHLGNLEFDDSSESFVRRVSLPMINPEDGTVIGVVSVAIHIDAIL